MFFVGVALGARGEGDGGGENQGAAEPGAGAEVVAEQGDTEQAADERFQI